MSVLAIRHGISEANNRHNAGTLAFASKEAHLMEQGRLQSATLQNTLLNEYGIDTTSTPVACSELTRTSETAFCAGFKAVNTYAILNEVEHGMDLGKLRKLLDKNILPYAALSTAEKLIQNPPPEQIWITHGLVIAGINNILGINKNNRFIPSFCQITMLPTAILKPQKIK